MIEPERFRSPEYLAVLTDAPATPACTITQQALTAMHNGAKAGYPQEVCGLLIGSCDGANWRVDEARIVENLNKVRAADRFQLDPKGYQQADRELRGSGREIIGVFHSHPDCPARPSPTDLENAWEGFLYPIISICDGKIADTRYWKLHEMSHAFQEVLTKEHDQ